MRHTQLDAESATLDAEALEHDALVAGGLCEAGRLNESLNRYCNLFPLDACRVQLSDGAFVNASHVELPGVEGPGFMAAQGPMHPDWHGPDTLPAFWQCVHEQRVGTIVCLAQPAPGFAGFASYWPEAGAASIFGKWRVRGGGETLSSDGLTVRRELHLSEILGGDPAAADSLGGDPAAASSRGEERSVVHLQSLCWPNYGVPKAAAPIRNVLEQCREARAATGAGATLVHCSGGVGRTGTFLAAYAGLSCTAWASPPTAAGAELSLLPTVRALRRQRHPMCVEGAEQLAYAYSVVDDPQLPPPTLAVLRSMPGAVDAQPVEPAATRGLIKVKLGKPKSSRDVCSDGELARLLDKASLPSSSRAPRPHWPGAYNL